LAVAGFSGDNCELNDDDCVDNGCANGGTCVDAVADYTCRCSPHWTGMHTCTVYTSPIYDCYYACPLQTFARPHLGHPLLSQKSERAYPKP